MAANSTNRLHSLDTLRGVTNIGMIAYHALWNLVYILDVDIPWYTGTWGYLWQQSICWTFIMLSGFCISLGKYHVKRGLSVFAGGIVVSAVTILVIPEKRILFGILTFIGSCMIIVGLADKWLRRIPAWVGLSASGVLFALTRNCNWGYLGFESLRFGSLPEEWYRNLFTAYLGFPPLGFRSSDYFSIFPWIFLFLFGYFLFPLIRDCDLSESFLKGTDIPVINWIGRHSLLVYLLHQPVLYFLCVVLPPMIRHMCS